jgi:hypothetical protein
MNPAALHCLAEEMTAAFKGERIAMSKSERIIELAEAQWVGVQESQDGSIILFRDPVTMSTLALLEQGLTVSGVTARLEATRKVFGGKS